MFPAAPGLDVGQVFEYAPVPLWLVDYSQVKAALDQGDGEGADFFSKMDANFMLECGQKVVILDANTRALQEMRAASRQELQQTLPQAFRCWLAEVFLQDQATVDGWELNSYALGTTQAAALPWALRCPGQLFSTASSRDCSRVLVHRADQDTLGKIQSYLHFLTHHDALTGLYNDMLFDEECRRMERSRRYPVSILLARVVGVTLVNPPERDVLLRCAADVLRTAFRIEDITARLGPDLFGVLLPGAGREALDKGVRRIRDLGAISNALCRDPRLRLALGTATAEGPGTLGEARRQAESALAKPEVQPGEGDNHIS